MVQHLLMIAFILNLNKIFLNSLMIIGKITLSYKVEFDEIKFVKKPEMIRKIC